MAPQHVSLEHASEDILEYDGIRLDRDARRASLAGRLLDLTPTEYRLLEYLLRQPGRACPRRELMTVAIAEQAVVIERTIDVHICALRRKLGSPERIETVRGVGYRFRPATP